MNNAGHRYLAPGSLRHIALLCRSWRNAASPKQRRLPRRDDIALTAANVAVKGPAATLTLLDDEGAVLRLLLDEPHAVLTPETVLSRIWGVGKVHNRRYLANIVGRINKGLARAGFAPKAIEDIRGVGYRLRLEGDNAYREGL